MPLDEPLLPPLLQAPAADHRSSPPCSAHPALPALPCPPRDYWCRLERHIRSPTSLCADVFVVTGPLFMPTLDATGQWVMKHPLIGQLVCWSIDWSVGAPPSLVAVPPHFYKPNAPIDPHTPLSAFVVPLELLEAVAGEQEWRQVLSEAAQEWRQYGLQRMGTLDRQTLIQGPQAPLALPAPAEAVTACSTGSSGRKAGAPPSLPHALLQGGGGNGAPSSSPLQSDAASGGSGSSDNSNAVSSPLRSDKDMAVAAFVLPNAPIDTPLSAFVVPMEPLEAVAGTRFFPELLTEARRQVLSEAAQEWRQYGLQRMGTFDRQTLIQGPQAPLPCPHPLRWSPPAAQAAAAGKQVRVQEVA
ncbi:hypothetical protein QJQ45_019271 [Haematococcus lacustris]|nr:hypothetical protein QJQ45_019271 [Haematococcus lacustris]